MVAALCWFKKTRCNFLFFCDDEPSKDALAIPLSQRCQNAPHALHRLPVQRRLARVTSETRTPGRCLKSLPRPFSSRFPRQTHHLCCRTCPDILQCRCNQKRRRRISSRCRLARLPSTTSRTQTLPLHTLHTRTHTLSLLYSPRSIHHCPRRRCPPLLPLLWRNRCHRQRLHIIPWSHRPSRQRYRRASQQTRSRLPRATSRVLFFHFPLRPTQSCTTSLRP